MIRFPNGRPRGLVHAMIEGQPGCGPSAWFYRGHHKALPDTVHVTCSICARHALKTQPPAAHHDTDVTPPTYRTH